MGGERTFTLKAGEAVVLDTDGESFWRICTLDVRFGFDPQYGRQVSMWGTLREFECPNTERTFEQLEEMTHAGSFPGPQSASPESPNAADISRWTPEQKAEIYAALYRDGVRIEDAERTIAKRAGK